MNHKSIIIVECEEKYGNIMAFIEVILPACSPTAVENDSFLLKWNVDKCHFVFKRLKVSHEDKTV